jgi:hypothetical protein
MQLKLAALWRSARLAATLPAEDAPDNIRERIVVTAATTLGVIVVALIAVLMGLVN